MVISYLLVNLLAIHFHFRFLYIRLLLRCSTIIENVHHVGNIIHYIRIIPVQSIRNKAFGVLLPPSI